MKRDRAHPDPVSIVAGLAICGLGVVLLHSPDPGGQAKRLLDRGFALQR